MTLPIDMVLVRHGDSEINIANRLSRAGDDSAFTAEFRTRHTASFRLTKLGREQAQVAGEWIGRELGGFDLYLASEYVRAIETAGLLGLPRANWLLDFYLSERDWADLEICPRSERKARFGDALRAQSVEPFFWHPPNGESSIQMCLGVDQVLAMLRRRYSGKRVIIVCHGGVMWAFRRVLERMSRERFKELYLSGDSDSTIYNCQILHYSRRDPLTGTIGKHADWLRMVRPTVDPVWDTGWCKVERPRYSNEELLEVAARSPAFLE